MAADLVLIQGLPGGPYRLDVVDLDDGGHRFIAGEMCVCDRAAWLFGHGPHWHDITAADCLTDLFTDLLTRYLAQETHP
jgi:hypothetical protein